MARAVLAAALVLAAVPAALVLAMMPASLWGDEFVRDSCDARAVAPFVQFLSLEQHIQVFDELEASGAIEPKHAEILRGLAREAREVPDLKTWVEMQCSNKEEV